jgi:UDP:flavonoid glycosyltransferase YjiC (YdhE family)
VHAGNHGVSCLGLRLGLPHVTLSAQPEHMFDGRRIAEAGAGRNLEPKRWTVPNIQAAVRETWDDHAMAERAAALAQELAPEFAGDPGELTADRIEAVMR